MTWQLKVCRQLAPAIVLIGGMHGCSRAGGSPIVASDFGGRALGAAGQGQPDAERSAPQTTMVMSPTGD